MKTAFADLPVTIFDVMSTLARDHEAINLGQGFPDDDGPEDIRQVAADALIRGPNQYPPMLGLADTRVAIAEHYRAFQALDLDPARETMVTSGGTEALASAILALVGDGDEVVLFQPMYDAYAPLVRRAGGTPRHVTLRAPDWSFTEDDLREVFSPNTRAIVFNNPLNPGAVVYSADQLELLAKLCIEFDVVAICDEVWEHVVFDGRPFVSMMGVPGMRDRTVKIGSAGKMFSLTGWKVGLVAAAPPLLNLVAKAHQFLTFTTPPNLQIAVGYGLRKDASYFASLRKALQIKRDYFVGAMENMGYPIRQSEGTYFATVDVGALGIDDDAAFAKRLVSDFGVASIPLSAFYAQKPSTNVLRFCFAKNQRTLDEGLARLRRAARELGLKG